MASIINANTSSGVTTTADTSGILQLQTASVTAVTIDASQNVGIGTASPSTQLQMNSGAATYSDQLRIRNTNFGNADIGVGSGVMALATDMSNIAFYTSSSLGTTGSALPTNERMRIDSNGNVGIATTTPATHGAFAIRRAVTTGFTTNCSFSTSDAANSTFDIGHSSNLVTLNAQGSALAFSAGSAERGRFDSSGNFQFNSGYGSVATAYGCRAWVNFNGTGTVAIRASGNVSSITDNGTGDYVVNFSTAIADANYNAVSMGRHWNGSSDNGFVVCFQNASSDGNTGRTTSSFRVSSHAQNSSLQDSPAISLSIFR